MARSHPGRPAKKGGRSKDTPGWSSALGILWLLGAIVFIIAGISRDQHSKYAGRRSELYPEHRGLHKNRSHAGVVKVVTQQMIITIFQAMLATTLGAIIAVPFPASGQPRSDRSQPAFDLALLPDERQR